MESFCPKCEAILPKEVIDDVNDLTTCISCGTMSYVSIVKTESKPNLLRPSIATPRNFSVQTKPNAFEITQPWTRYSSWVWGIVSISNLFLSVFLLKFFFGHISIWLGFVCLCFYMVSSSMTYRLMMPFTKIALEKTLTISSKQGPFRSAKEYSYNVISVKHGSLLWKTKKKQVLYTTDIKQIYTSALYSSDDKNQQIQSSYSVDVVLQNGYTICLLDKLTTPEEALFVEQKLEEKLGLLQSEPA